LWALDTRAQLRNSDIRRNNTRLEVSEPLQYNLVVGLQLRGVCLGCPAPPGEGHRSQGEGENQKHRSGGDEQHLD
jgi:hypothetical protein